MLKIDKKDPLYLQVYEQLKQHILSQGWKPGEKLIESKIAAELKLSRSPVREALRILEHEGLLTKKEQNLYIYQPSVEDIIELYQLRFSLEALSCYLAAEAATEEELAHLKEIIWMTELALEKEDKQEIYEWNTQFHETIIRASKNKHLITVMDSLQAKVLYCRNMLVQFDYMRVDSFIQEHVTIYESIRNHKKEEAKRLMEAHIQMDLDRILALFPNQTVTGGLKS